MKSFTLIEVIISVMILFIAVNISLDLASNSFSLFNGFVSRNNFILSSSLVFCEKRGGRLDEVVRDFDIKNDEILKMLRREKIEFKKRIDLKTEIENKKITVYKLNALNKNHMALVYSIEVK